MNAEMHQLKDGRDVVIREAVAGDAKNLLEYIETISGESTFISMSPGEFEMTEEEETAFVETSKECEHALYLVALVENEIAGNLHFATRNRARVRHCGEFGMSVRRDFWALGIGGLLLDVLIAWGRDSGIVTKIHLRVRTDNERAISLYEGRGFAREGTHLRDFVVDGVYHDHHIMGLEV